MRVRVSSWAPSKRLRLRPRCRVRAGASYTFSGWLMWGWGRRPRRDVVDVVVSNFQTGCLNQLLGARPGHLGQVDCCCGPYVKKFLIGNQDVLFFLAGLREALLQCARRAITTGHLVRLRQLVEVIWEFGPS